MTEQAAHSGFPGFPEVPDGLVVVVKRDCPTCQLVLPVLEQLAARGAAVTVISQDDPGFPEHAAPTFDRELELSERFEIEVVPTLLRLEKGAVVQRALGWNRDQWQDLSGIAPLGDGLPAARPGCGARNLEPDHVERLVRRRSGVQTSARQVLLGSHEDPIETCFARGWTDGLPVVPPTRERVLRMLSGTTRAPAEVLAEVPPDYAPCSVEKVAINAVMAGCLPEYLPVVLAAVEAACTEEFNWHGLAATTYFAGPVVIVNGPITRAIDMNSGINALGQGNRANATIGRALQLTLRNVGGARPGGVDRATLGNPGKLTFCFAENEADSPWESLARERGIPAGASAVTLFAGEGPRGIVDQRSRRPESLARSLALGLRSVAHPKLALAFDAVVVISPEHARVFNEAGWTKARLRSELLGQLMLSGSEMVRGADGCDEGLPESVAASSKLPEVRVPKFRPDGLWFVHAGGTAGLFSAIIGGWINGEGGSQPVTREVKS